MIIKEMFKHLNIDFLSLLSEIKLTLLGDRAISVQNFKKIHSYNDKAIVLLIKSSMLIIEGEGFKIAEMGKKDLMVTGKILKIYFDKG